MEKFDFTGKTLLPLCTNEGSGMGAERDIQKTCPGVKLAEGLSITGSQAVNARSQVEK